MHKSYLVIELQAQKMLKEFEARVARALASAVTPITAYMYTIGALQLPCTFGHQSGQHVAKEPSSFPNRIPPFFY